MPLARLRRSFQFPHNKVGKHAMDRHTRLLGVEEKFVVCDSVNAAPNRVADPHSRVTQQQDERFEPLSIGDTGAFGVFVERRQNLEYFRVREGHRWSVLNLWSFKVDCRVIVDPLPPLAEPKESAQS